MNESENLKAKIDNLERELQQLQRDRFANLSTNDVERLKGYIFERSALNTSGSATGALIVSYNGERRAIPTYSNFPPA